MFGMLRLSSSATILLLLTGVKGTCWYSSEEGFPFCDSVRGGSTMVASPHHYDDREQIDHLQRQHQQQQQQQQQPQHQHQHQQNPIADFPSIDLQHLALSLRYTCEINRQLQHTADLAPSIHDDLIAFHSSHQEQVHVHPSQQWHSPIQSKSPQASSSSSSSSSADITLFHAKTPRGNGRGVSRWGPDLHKYLQYIVSTLQIQQQPLILALSVIYLDRASSVETSRSNGAPPCPFCSPRTVHRLILISIILATQAVRGHDSVDLQLLQRDLGIPTEQLQHMEHWMRQALGDTGFYVMPQQFQEFFENWNRTWNRPKIRKSESVLSAAPKKHSIRYNTNTQTETETENQPTPHHHQSMLVRPAPASYSPNDDGNNNIQNDSPPPPMESTADATLSCWA